MAMLLLLHSHNHTLKTAQSYLSDIAIGTIGGFGPLSYELAMHATIDFVEK